MTEKSFAVITKIIIIVGATLAVAISGYQKNAVVKSEADKRSQITARYQKYTPEFPQVKGITVRELRSLQQQNRNIVLVDVREAEEREVSIIPGAISTEQFERNLKQYTGSNQLVIAYCTIGYRSGKYANLWRNKGLDILNLEGSLLAWSHIQGKLTDAEGLTNKVHVFSRKWQLLADDYQAIW